MKIELLTTAALVTLALGCATPESKCVAEDGMKSAVEAPPKVEEKAPAAAIFDAEELAVMTTSTTVSEVRLYLDADGRARKVAVYHTDAERVPIEARAAATAAHPGATARYYETERYADVGRRYEVELLTEDGREIEVSVAADGLLYYTEEAIAPDALPEAITAAVAARVPGAAIIEGESKKGPSLDLVVVKAKGADGRTHYLAFDGGELVRHSVRHPAQIEVVLPL